MLLSAWCVRALKERLLAWRSKERLFRVQPVANLFICFASRLIGVDSLNNSKNGGKHDVHVHHELPQTLAKKDTNVRTKCISYDTMLPFFLRCLISSTPVYCLKREVFVVLRPFVWKPESSSSCRRSTAVSSTSSEHHQPTNVGFSVQHSTYFISDVLLSTFEIECEHVEYTS